MTHARMSTAGWVHRVLPGTKLGRTACWIVLGSIVLFAASQSAMLSVEALTGATSVEGIPRVILIGLSLTSFALGLTAGVVAAVAVVRKHERGALVYATMVPGLLIIVFLLGEFLVPH